MSTPPQSSKDKEKLFLENLEHLAELKKTLEKNFKFLSDYL